jgi:general stress protein 26
MAAEFSSLLKSFSTGFLVTRSPEGLLHGRPMHVASAEESGAGFKRVACYVVVPENSFAGFKNVNCIVAGNIWFVTNIKSPKCEDIRQHPLEVLVTYVRF